MLVAVLFSICSSIEGRNVYVDLLGKNSPFADASSVDRHLSNLQKLNSLQSQILGVRPTSRDQINFDADPTRPDQLPYLFEGDIILTESQMDTILRNTEDQLWTKQGSPMRPRRSMTSSLYSRWPAFPISYYINVDSGVSEPAVLAGISRWETDTCVKFTRQYSRTRGNGLEFFLGSGCYSMIGRNGYSSQQISIGHGCTSLGTVTHEIGHALGFFHEQGRYDRDAYVTIEPKNIQNGYISQFIKQARSTMEDYGVGYDYGSVMHYDQTSFTSNGRPTIKTIDSNYQQTIGQREGPSFMDVKRINLAYCNSTCSTVLDCFNGGYTDPKTCSACRCPSGFGGTLCDRAATNAAQCGSGDLSASGSLQLISVNGGVSCFFVIKAPPGRRVYYEVPTFRFTACSSTFLEIKYTADMQAAGARFCLTHPKSSYSQGDTLVVIYRGSSTTSFTLKYRYDPPDMVTAPTTTPIPTTRSSTTTATTAIHSTTTVKVMPTQAITTRPAPSRMCTAWSECSAPCGGCGVYTRRCNGVVEKSFCNKQPCKFNFCCKPFLFVQQGFCFHPYNDDQLINDAEKRTITLDGDKGNESTIIEGSAEIQSLLE